MSELGVSANSASIVRHYGFLDGLIIDEADRAEAGRIDIDVEVTATWMRSLEDRDRLAASCLDFASRLSVRAEARVT